ncbi:MAG: hypothetical protein AAF149_19115 [Bacteroidota bacterium]
MFTILIVEKRGTNDWYYAITAISFLSFVISFFQGGKGISGKGSGHATNPYFNWQAITALHLSENKSIR